MILEPKVLSDYRTRFLEALQEQQIDAAIDIAARLSTGSIARLLTNVEYEAITDFLKNLDEKKAGDILSKMPPEMAVEILIELSPREASELLDDMPADHAADIVSVLSDENASRLLKSLPPNLEKVIRDLMKYEEGTVGSVMNNKFVGIKEDATIEDTLMAIYDAPADVENRSYIYVVNDNRNIQGVVSIKDLLRAKPQDSIKSIMMPEVVAVHTDDSVLDAAKLLRNRRFEMLPVLNDKDQITGVLLMDDAIEILSQSLIDQFVQIGAASADESFFTPPLGSVKKRLPWMAINIFLNLGAVAVISYFEETIAAVAALAVFLPMITDMGGNVGIQALSVSIRSIALGEVRLGEYWRALKKELIIGLINGLALGALFAILAIVIRSNPVLGLVAGTALAVNVLLAGVIGGTLPFFIKKMGGDPAMMTGPVLTTITDITGVTIYLGLSTIFLANLLM